jgi:symplekin
VLLVTAVINSLGGLIKSRASISAKILNTVLSFNPLEYATQPLTTKSTLMIRSLERTIRALFFNTQRRFMASLSCLLAFTNSCFRNPNHPLGPRMQVYLDRLHQSRVVLFQEASRKRRALSSAGGQEESAKRPRLEAAAAPAAQPGPVSIAQIFTLNADPGQTFNVTAIPHDVVSKLLVPLLRKVDQSKLVTAIQTVKSRMSSLAQAQAQAKQLAATQAFSEDDEEYEPDFQPIEDPQQLANRLEMESSEDLGIGIPKPSQLDLGSFELPAPQKLSQNDLHMLTTSMLDSLFARLELTPTTSSLPTDAKPGFNRLAAQTNDRNALITTLTRLITRPTAGMAADNLNELSNRGRYKLLQYILSDWRRRMEVAITWLTEEWYNDQICAKEYQTQKTRGERPQENFSVWMVRFLDELSAYIGSEQENLLIRFVAGVPGLNSEILARVKMLANDPERVMMVVKVIQ